MARTSELVHCFPSMNRNGIGQLPLSGVRVLDLSRVLAGPLAAQMLGDLGAEVIKVERPGKGDDTRAWGPPFAAGESAYFLCANRNKRSITVNLKSARGVQIIHSLATKSDVVIENLKVGEADRLGFGYESLRPLNPRLVYASISGYGADGPMGQHPGYDFMAQAFAGLMHITGDAASGPVKVGVAITDVMTAFLTQGACMAALLSRDKTGVGQRVDLSLMESQLAALANVASNYLVSGVEAVRRGNSHPSIVPYQMFETADIPLAVGAGNDQQFQRLCHLLELGDVGADDRFRTNEARVRNRDKLFEILQNEFWKYPHHVLQGKLEEATIPCSPVNNMETVFNHPQVKHREMVSEIEHPTAGKIKLVSHPVKYRETPASIRRPPPTLGQHTEEILREDLGIAATEIEQMLRDGVI